MAKGYKLVITHFRGLQAKYNYLDSISPQPHIAFCLQPSEVGYNYYLFPIGVHASNAISHSLTLCTHMYVYAHVLYIMQCVHWHAWSQTVTIIVLQYVSL